MTEHANTARVCLALGAFFMALTLGLAATYYLHFRPMWSPAVVAPAARLLNDPTAPVEAIRRTALQGHQTLLASFEVIDTMMFVLLITNIASGAAFLYAFFSIRKLATAGPNRAL